MNNKGVFFSIMLAGKKDGCNECTHWNATDAVKNFYRENFLINQFIEKKKEFVKIYTCEQMLVILV